MVIAVGVAVIVGVMGEAGVLGALAVGKSVARGAGVVVCSGAQEVRKRARREMHKSRVRNAIHSRL